MAGWMVTSPHGPLPVASWACLRCSEGSGGQQFVGIGAELPTADSFRDAAAEHLRATGHQVMFWRGTAEDLHPMATEPVR